MFFSSNLYRKGFTLVEMLTVLTIISVLAGLLLPAVLGARNRAHSVKCLSNMRQLLAAVTMYEQDYSRYPALTRGLDQPKAGIGGTGKLVTVLAPYVRDVDVFLCPANAAAVFGPNPDGHGTSYRYNEWINSGAAYSGNIYPTWAVVLIDNKEWKPRRSGGANLGFLDGHVKWHSQSGPQGYEYGKDPYGNQKWMNWGQP